MESLKERIEKLIMSKNGICSDCLNELDKTIAEIEKISMWRNELEVVPKEAVLKALDSKRRKV